MLWFARACMPALIFSATLVAQDGASDSAAVVNAIVTGPSGFVSSFIQKMAWRSGDGIAIVIARTLPRNSLRDPEKARRVIAVIQIAFGNPALITATENKNPGVSLLLLDAILRDASDSTVQQAAQALMTKLEGLASAQAAIH